jgi:hypothetical protein
MGLEKPYVRFFIIFRQFSVSLTTDFDIGITISKYRNVGVAY